MSGEIVVREASIDDAEQLSSIYNHYILQTSVTFEEIAITAGEMVSRIEEIRKVSLPWLVAERNGAILGYTYASRWRTRSAYRFSVETTIYVAPANGGQGIGSLLYSNLLSELRKLDIHAAMGGVALPNEPSIALHRKFGFRKVAHFEQVGFKFSRWIDMTYWQLLL